MGHWRYLRLSGSSLAWVALFGIFTACTSSDDGEAANTVAGTEDQSGPSQDGVSSSSTDNDNSSGSTATGSTATGSTATGSTATGSATPEGQTSATAMAQPTTMSSDDSTNELTGADDQPADDQGGSGGTGASASGDGSDSTGGGGGAGGADGAGSMGGAGGVAGDPSEELPSGEILSVAEFCSRRAHLDDDWCEYRDRCCTAEDIASSTFWLPGCLVQDLAEEACLEELGEADQDGLTFDGAWATQCLEALGQLGFKPPEQCSGTLGDVSYESNHREPLMWQLSACQNMLTANVGEGEPCNNVRACAPGLGCGPSSGPTDDFLCHSRGGVGAPCYSVNECELGLTCYPLLEDGFCQPLAPEGAPCDSVEDCQDGNMCHLDYCAPTLSLGQDCPNFTFCLSKLSCDFSNATCAALLSDGEGPCSSDFDCEGRCDTTNSTCTSICGGTR